MKTVVATFILLVGLATAALAADLNPVARGKQLFESADLGTNGKSCASCHPKGRLLSKAASYEEEELVGIVNRCITLALAGKPLPAESADMKAIIMYMRTFDTP
jgi:cytochrome c